jgi:hypothetical protein
MQRRRITIRFVTDTMTLSASIAAWSSALGVR